MNKLSIKNAPLKYLHSFIIDFTDKKGRPHKWEVVSREPIERLEAEMFQKAKYTDGAQIIACHPIKKTLILIKEYRPIYNGYVYSFPAGLQDPNEDLKTAAIREFKEETGLDLSIDHIEPARYTSVGLTNEKVNIVYGTYSGDFSTDFLKGSEDITPIEVDREEAIRILNEEEVPIRTAMILQQIYSLGHSVF